MASFLSSNKRRRAYPDWSILCSDLLRKIFNGLNVAEKRCFASVCRSWRTSAKDEIKSLLNSSVPKSPSLLLPDVHIRGYARKGDCSMLSLNGDDGMLKPVKMPLESQFHGSCRGGWLLLMMRKTNLVLWNPVFDVKIHLPSVLTFPCVQKVSEKWISKAAVFGSDPMSSSDCGVVVIYGSGNLAFVKYGDCQWTDVDGSASSGYEDVTGFKNSILGISNNGEVEVWDFTAPSPRKTMEIKAPFPQDMVESKEHLRDKYTHRSYIVESQDSILLVVRWIGNFVHPNGILLTEDDIIEEDDPFLIAPYWTKKFYVYQLDIQTNTWVLVESLGNQLLFLGGNQSFSLDAEDSAGFEKNSIYFTDDYWDRIDEHECYGGHDMGVYSLKDEIFHGICGFEDDKISPSFWVF